MSIKAMASIVVAVAFTVIAARNAAPSAAMDSPWLRHAVQVNEALPPGHPPIDAGRLPPGHPPVGPQYPRLPEGHPPIPWMEPGCPAGADPMSPDDIERDGGFLREKPPVIST